MNSLFVICSVVLLILCSCASTPRMEEGVPPPRPPIPSSEVANALVSLSDRLQHSVAAISHDLEEKIPTDATRKTTLHWRIRTFEICARARSRENAMSGLIELWFWTVVNTRHYQTGSGKDKFGLSQETIVKKASEIEAIAERMVRRAVPPNRYDALKAKLEEAATQGEEYLSGDASKSDPLGSILEATKLSNLLSITLSPFDAFSGVKTGGDAAARMAVTADRAVTLLVDYPELLSWHMQAALLEIQAQDTPKALLAELKRTNASIEALVVIARELPEKIRTEGVALLDQSRPAQTDVRETLKALNEAAVSLEKLNAGVLQLITTITPTKVDAKPAELAGQAPQAAQAAQPIQPPRPFDIREYTTALNAAAATARDLQATLKSTSALIESPAVPAHLAEADHTLQKLIATIAWWTLAVILFATVCIFTCVKLLWRQPPRII